MEGSGVNKTEINLKHLRSRSVRDLVANILSIDPSSHCTPLSNFICNTTNGSEFMVHTSYFEMHLPIGWHHMLTSGSKFYSAYCCSDPFFVRQQIISLCDQGLLFFNGKDWTWDLQKIKDTTISCDVVTMISEEIQQLPCLTKCTLMVSETTPFIFIITNNFNVWIMNITFEYYLLS